MKRILMFVMLLVNVVECFEEKLIEISMKEEEANGTLVVDLRKEISSFSSLNNSKGFQMKFVRQCSNLFVDEENFFLIRSFGIDREEICGSNQDKCFINCHLLIEKQENLKLIHLKIEIIDVNDHQPRFLRKKVFFNISNENLEKNGNFSIQLEKAEDKDFVFNHSYHLNCSDCQEEDFPFQLIDEKRNYFLELLICKEKIQKKKYEMELIVIDEDEEKDSCLIEIEFLEENFHSIEFQSNLYQIFIQHFNESFLGKVQLKTKSVHQQHPIKYRLIFSNDFHSNIFSIDETNGEIRLNNLEEIQLNSFYQFFVEASTSFFSTLTTVQIFFNSSSSFQNSSNNKDHFIEILIPKSFHRNSQIFIQENLLVPLTILQLFTSSSLNFHSSIQKSYFHLKQLDEHSFEFLLLQSIDFEFIQQIHLNFTQQDSHLSKSLLINIEDVNDSPPHLLQSHFSFQIQENNPFPFLLYTFEAFDQDSFHHFTFFSNDIDQQIFKINSTSGQLTILQSLDREIQSIYSFSICIFDQLFQTCSTIDLFIQDQNDNICSFNSSSLLLSIDENLPSNSFLYQFQANDPDLNENGTLFYSFLSSTSFLKINSSSGSIHTTSSSFDYETIQSYSIIVQACDNIRSLPSFCCSIELHLNINDRDDHPPTLIFPSNTQQIFIIDYSNQTMPQIKAFDKDLSPQFRIIFFDIIGGSLNSSIDIHKYSGQLSLRHPSSFPLFGTFILSISNQTIVHLRLLIHQNQTQIIDYLRSFDQQQHQQIQSFFSSYFIYLMSLPLLLLAMIISLILSIYLCKHRCKSFDETLMNTPSTTTLSNRSISTTNHKKLYETYYSFGDSFISPQVIHL